jgi:hypothetical protein
MEIGLGALESIGIVHTVVHGIRIDRCQHLVLDQDHALVLHLGLDLVLGLDLDLFLVLDLDLDLFLVLVLVLVLVLGRDMGQHIKTN